VVAFVPYEKLDETLRMVDIKDDILVPTSDSDIDVKKNVLGMGNRGLYKFMKRMGVTTAETCGEVNGGCYSEINLRLMRHGIDFIPNLHYPIKGSILGGVYFTEEQWRKFEESKKQFSRWERKTFKDYLSKLGVSRDSCEAALLRGIIESVGDKYLHPMTIDYLCEGWSKKEKKKALKRLEKENVLRICPAEKVLNRGEVAACNRLNRWLREHEGLKYRGEVVIPQIECELLK
jgi:hypothetical protein